VPAKPAPAVVRGSGKPTPLPAVAPAGRSPASPPP